MIRKYQNGVYSFILRMIGSKMDAQDLTQQVFIEDFKGLKAFKGKSLFRTWLFRIIKNVCRSHPRHNSLFSNNSLDKVNHTCFEEEVIYKKQMQVLRKLISQLPYKQRLTLMLEESVVDFIPQVSYSYQEEYFETEDLEAILAQDLEEYLEIY